MYKSIAYYIMLIRFLAYCGVYGYGFYADKIQLPNTVIVTTALSAFFCVFIIIKKVFLKRLGTKELFWFFILNTMIIIINIIYMRTASPVTINIFELLVIGTLLDIIINIVVIVLSFRASRYITVSSDNNFAALAVKETGGQYEDRPL